MIGCTTGVWLGASDAARRLEAHAPQLDAGLRVERAERAAADVDVQALPFWLTRRRVAHAAADRIHAPLHLAVLAGHAIAMIVPAPSESEPM